MSKVILITGGSSGIGKAIGEFLTEKGFTVFGCQFRAQINHILGLDIPP